MKIRLTWLLVLSLLLSAVGCGSEQAPITETHPQHAVEDVTDAPEPAVPEITPNPENNPQPKPEIIPQPEPEVESTSEPETQPDVEVVPQPDPETQPEAEVIPQLEPESPPAPEASENLLPVLMYHHVVPDDSSCNDMTVTIGKLSDDLRWLRDHGYETILPRDLAAGISLPEKPVLITFDDGYTSNYQLLFPLLKEHNAKAVISIITCMPDIPTTNFCSWDMLREMNASGLVEIGSHTYQLHNLDGRGGNFTPGGTNGIQRAPEESDADFQLRVLDDLQKSHDRIEVELGTEVICFAYPFGITEPDAQALIDNLFPVTLITKKGIADLSTGPKNLPRYTVTMNTSLASILDA